MARRRLLIIGSGKRVTKAALPVFECASEHFELAGIFSRTAKSIESGGCSYDVAALDTLTEQTLREIDLIYMVVAKSAVPKVIAQLTALGVSHLDLLIETPVMLFRHYGHLGLLSSFRQVWVSEDTKPLPCFAPIRSLAASGELGALQSVLLEESAYAYHGVAMLKSALDCKRIKSARQARRADGRRDRTFKLEGADGASRVGRIIDPRNYSRGKLRFEFERGVVADHEVDGALHLEAKLLNDELTGFRVGDHQREFDNAERSLMGTPGEGLGLTAWMDGMKRVGFLALVRDIAADRGAYSLDDAVEDAVVDYHLEKFKRYHATPLTDPRKPLARLSYRLLTRIAGG